MSHPLYRATPCHQNAVPFLKHREPLLTPHRLQPQFSALFKRKTDNHPHSLSPLSRLIVSAESIPKSHSPLNPGKFTRYLRPLSGQFPSLISPSHTDAGAGFSVFVSICPTGPIPQCFLLSQETTATPKSRGAIPSPASTSHDHGGGSHPHLQGCDASHLASLLPLHAKARFL